MTTTTIPTKSEIEKIIADITADIIGDTPVSVQLNTALSNMASKNEMLALRKEVNALRNEIEKLIELVGDTSVSEQINMAINNPEN